ncbi:MAG: PAS domain S-box protein, partial [Nitrospirae bacterium]|nr:PAS domain S-box protein [Nitrospirota bacterium]
MNRIVAMSIRSQLFLIALIVAIPAACIIIFSGINLRNEAMSEARIQTQKVADRIASDQHNLVVAAQQLLTALAQLPDVTSHNAVGIQPILSEILKLNPQYANIFIADNAGYVWTQGAQAKPVNVTDRRYFMNALASGQFSSGEYIISKAIKKPVLNFASPLKDKKGEFIGVIGVAFNLDYYGRTMEKLEVPHRMNFLLVDHRGTVLFRSINAAQIAGNQDRPELFMHMQSKTDGDTFIDRGNDGVKRFMTFRKLSLKGEALPYMYIRVGIPVDMVLSEANMALMYSLILFTLFLMSAFFLSGLIGKRSIADRLALLKMASKRLADGDLQTRASDLVSGGELGELALAFDGMAEQIALRELSLFDKTAEQDTILQNAIVGVAFVKERRFSRVNRKMEQMFGYDRNEMDQLSTELIYPSHEAFEQAGKAAYASLAEGKAYFLELTMKRKDGSCFWASLSGQAVDRSEIGKGSIWILQDITKRKRAEEELHKSEERYRELVENANSIILRWDMQGNITFLNEYGLNFFGYTEAEIIGKNVMGTIVPKAARDGADLERMIEGICLHPAAYEKNENENICKDGRRVFINWSNKPIHNVSGDYIGILSVGNDVTYRRQIESQLQKSLTEKETLLRELYH